jgi:hypothetical protein
MKVSSYYLIFVAILASSAHADTILGSAANFGVLAGTTVTNIGNTVVVGDVGVSPGTAITGFGPGLVVGAIHANDSAASTGAADLLIAYGTLSGLAPNRNLSNTDLGGLTLTSGVYKFDAAAALTGNLNLSGTGSFIFQIGTGFNIADNSSIFTIGGADPFNVYFQVGSSATAGTGDVIQGNIVSLQSISLATGSSLTGRALAINGAVTLQDNAISINSATSSTPEPDTLALSGIAVLIALGWTPLRRKLTGLSNAAAAE